MDITFNHISEKIAHELVRIAGDGSKSVSEPTSMQMQNRFMSTLHSAGGCMMHSAIMRKLHLTKREMQEITESLVESGMISKHFVTNPKNTGIAYTEIERSLEDEPAADAEENLNVRNSFRPVGNRIPCSLINAAGDIKRFFSKTFIIWKVLGKHTSMFHEIG